MRDLVVLVLHLLTTIARLVGPGGARSVVAESVLLKQQLLIVKPDTLIRWHRQGFQLLWRWKSRPRGRPRLPADLRRLIAEMASANRTWGEQRIASELLVKLGIHVSPRTVRRYMTTSRAPRDGARSQLWSTFVRNHASAVLAYDFLVVVTATFRVLYSLWCWKSARAGSATGM